MNIAETARTARRSLEFDGVRDAAAVLVIFELVLVIPAYQVDYLDTSSSLRLTHLVQISRYSEKA